MLARTAVVLAASIGAIFAVKAASPAQPALASALTVPSILEIHLDSMLDYRATASGAQDVQPIALQRGVGLDGSIRRSSTLPLAFAGNPFGSPWSGHSACKVDLATGSPTLSEIDINLPAPSFSWPIARSFNSRQAAGATHRDSDGPQGTNWFQNSSPEIALYTHPSDDTKDLVYVIYAADAFAEYRRVSTNSNTFRATNGASGAILFEVGIGDEPDTYTLYDMAGHQAVFFGFDANADVETNSVLTSSGKGQLWKISDAADNCAFVGHETDPVAAISLGYSVERTMLAAYDTANRRYSYTYSAIDGDDHLTKVLVEIEDGDDWSNPSNPREVARVEYDYYDTVDEEFGLSGDLKLVTVVSPLEYDGVSVELDTTRRKHYRYWLGSSGPSHAIRAVLDWEGARALDHTSATSYLTEAYGEGFDEYLALAFGYDGVNRVTSATVNGCGCGGGADGAHLFSYGAGLALEGGTPPSGTSGYDNTWKTNTEVIDPSGLYHLQYFDEAGQPLSLVKSDGDPLGTGPQPDMWITRVERNSAGVVDEIATPANEADYVYSTGAITAGSTGLVRTFTLETAGQTKGYITDTMWKEGNNSYLEGSRAQSVVEITVGDTTVARPYVTSSRSYPTAIQSGTSGSLLTSYTTTFYTGTGALVPKKVVTTLPAVLGIHNGSGTSNTSTVFFNQDGTPSFRESTGGILSFTGYESGQVALKVRAADTTQNGTLQAFNGVAIPTELASRTSDLHHVTWIEHDLQGRFTSQTVQGDPDSAASYSTLLDGRTVTLSYPLAVTTGTAPNETVTYHGPVSFSVQNHAGKTEASGAVAYSGNTTTADLATHINEFDDDLIGALTGELSGPSATVVRLSTSIYDAPGKQLKESRSYFEVPVDGVGVDGTNYDPTFFAYDTSGRRIRTLEASGTIRRTDFDALGRAILSEVGTDDTGDAGSSMAGANNMVKVSATEYDSGTDGGNSFATKRTSYRDGTGTDTTTTYDVRGRSILTQNPLSPHYFSKYDNLGRQVASGAFSSVVSIVLGTDDPTSEVANRLGLSETFYDELGRAWKRTSHEIDPEDGSDDSTTDSLTWFDAEGRTTKTTGSSYTKALYDDLGRRTHSFQLGGDDDTGYTDADDVSGDVVIEESQSVYLDDLLVMSVQLQRFHDDDSTGTAGALDTNADADDLKVTAANLAGRVQITAYWHDSLDRVIDTVRFGTHADIDFDRFDMDAPDRSDAELRTTRSYADDGHVVQVTDALGIVSQTDVDDLGRTTFTYANYGDGAPSGTDSDQKVGYAYTDGLRTKITAYVPAGGTDQETVYTYGTTNGTSAGESETATGHLLQKVQYPDSAGGTDVVTYAYDTQSTLTWEKDQAGNITESDLDSAGRVTSRKVTTLASGFDGAVRRVDTTYTDKGQREKVTQYDAATSGSIVDEVLFGYAAHGAVDSFRQDVNSAVDAFGSVDDYEVSYTFAAGTGGINGFRRTGMTLPSGNSISYLYDGIDDEISRVARLKDGVVTIAGYDYLGMGNVVGTSYAVPDVNSVLYGSTSGDYDYGLDIFNRVTRSNWTKVLAGADVDMYDVGITYDRGSNITRAEDAIFSGRDVEYTMDGLDRLTQAEEGSWSGSAITSKTRDQMWTLDHLGNWDENNLDLNADGDYLDPEEIDESRTHNDVNELSNRTLGVFPFLVNYSPTYDAVGNMTADGKAYKFVYDAFGRLREVRDRWDSSPIAEYRYNGLGFQIAVHEDTDIDGDVDGSDLWYYNAFDEAWRKLATFRGSDGRPKEEFVPHMAGFGGYGGSSYINDVVLRNKDADKAWTVASDGDLEEQIFYCSNWRGDVVMLLMGSKYQVEQVRYSAYGVSFAIPAGDLDSDGDVDAADLAILSGWIATPYEYHYQGDFNLDGFLDSTDVYLGINVYAGASGGRGALSWKGNQIGYAGMQRLETGQYLARYRVYDAELGRWTRRDPLGYVDGMSLIPYSQLNPVWHRDPYGLTITGGGAAKSKSPYHIVPHGIGPYEDCCAGAFGEAPDAAGTVACCDGVYVRCINADKLPQTSMKGLFFILGRALAHEQGHLDKNHMGPCPLSPGRSRGFKWTPGWARGTTPDNISDYENELGYAELDALDGDLAHPFCDADCQAAINQRIKELQVWLDKL